MNSTVIAIDLAKDVFEVAVSDVPGQVREGFRFSRKRMTSWICERTPSTVIMEACGTSHDWARLMSRFSHRVFLIPPHIVRQYRSGNKTDRRDVKALLEAFRNEEIHPVPIKSEAQQGMMGLHRLRSGWMSTRTARINEVRGLLREFGIMLPIGAARFLERASAALHEENCSIPVSLRMVLELAFEELVELDRRIDFVEKRISEVGRTMPKVADLQSLPGVGILTSTAATAGLVDLHRFRSGRQLSCALGLTPREHSSGKRRWLGRITKRGDRYLRTLLIHGGRSLLRAAKTKRSPSRLEAWALDRERQIGHNKAAVAVANKLARLMWIVWVRGVRYQPQAV